MPCSSAIHADWTGCYGPYGTRRQRAPTTHPRTAPLASGSRHEPAKSNRPDPPLPLTKSGKQY